MQTTLLCMFYALCFMFYVLCFMLYVLCFMLYVLCFMFYAICFMFYALCFMLYVFLWLTSALSNWDKNNQGGLFLKSFYLLDSKPKPKHKYVLCFMLYILHLCFTLSKRREDCLFGKITIFGFPKIPNFPEIPVQF